MALNEDCDGEVSLIIYFEAHTSIDDKCCIPPRLTSISGSVVRTVSVHFAFVRNNDE